MTRAEKASPGRHRVPRAGVMLLALVALLAGCDRSGEERAGNGVVRVAAPTGTEADRSAILAALDALEPGGTVQFAPGTYLVGEILRVETPGVTLLGHAEGTTLRGCALDAFAEAEEEFEAAIGRQDFAAAELSVARCGTLEVHGGGTTIRGFRFEQSRLGVCLNTCAGGDVPPGPEQEHGGYVVEQNTFRDSSNGVRGQMLSDTRSIIRDNTFVNTFHAVSVGGRNIHIVDNRISAPEPSRVPGSGLVTFAIGLGGERNLVAGNRIEGHPDGIVLVTLPGQVHRGNTIRDNTIAVSRVPVPAGTTVPLQIENENDSTVVGTPIAFEYIPLRLPGSDPEADPGRFVENTIEGNEILGAEGVGIHIENGIRNRILGNTVRSVLPREPYPGNTLAAAPSWPRANGSGIWLSPGSSENDITGNTFADVAGPLVTVEGTGNRVTVEDTTRVLDLGADNEVTVAGGGGN